MNLTEASNFIRVWIILTAFIVQFNCYMNGFELPQSLYTLLSSAFGFGITFLPSPGNVVGSSVSMLTSAYVVSQSDLFDGLPTYLHTLPCTLETEIRTDHPEYIVWEGWTTGRLCTSQKQQMLTVGRGMDDYMETISDGCTHNMTVTKYDSSSGRDGWYGLIKSPRTEHLPGKSCRDILSTGIHSEENGMKVESSNENQDL